MYLYMCTPIVCAKYLTYESPKLAISYLYLYLILSLSLFLEFQFNLIYLGLKQRTFGVCTASMVSYPG